MPARPGHLLKAPSKCAALGILSEVPSLSSGKKEADGGHFQDRVQSDGGRTYGSRMGTLVECDLTEYEVSCQTIA